MSQHTKIILVLENRKFLRKKEDADRWLFRMFDKEIFEFYDKTGIAGYIAYKNYGYWNARVKKYKI